MSQKKTKPALYLHELPPPWQKLFMPLVREKIGQGIDKAEAEKSSERELLRSFACQQAPKVKMGKEPELFGAG